jgi:hypothetical protein
MLEQEPAGPGGQRAVDVLVEVEGRQHDDPAAGAGLLGQDPPGGLEAVHFRHPDVHQHDVRTVFERSGDGLGAVGGLGDNGDPGIAQDHAEAGADQVLVVGNENARGGFTGRAAGTAHNSTAHDGTGTASGDGCQGNRARTCHPPPGWLPAFRSP